MELKQCVTFGISRQMVSYQELSGNKIIICMQITIN